MKKNFLLSTAAVVLCAGLMTMPASKAQAQQETGSLAYFALTEAELRDHYHEWKVFLEYNMYREPCQHYREPPAGFVFIGCEVYRQGSLVTAIEPSAGEASLPVSTIYFDFDQSSIRGSERAKLDGIIAELERGSPARVTVAGYADRAGSNEYNIGLSQRRANAVIDELVARGIRRDMIERESYGETDLAVPTADGVPLQANRRAVIVEFER